MKTTRTAGLTLLLVVLTVPVTLNVAGSQGYSKIHGISGLAQELSTFSVPKISQLSNVSIGSASLATTSPTEYSSEAQANDAPFNFSACLLVKDDNKVLPEWLAYHFEVLPLRHLILGLDPYILTSPEPILQKFRDLGMSIEVWKADDFLENRQYIPEPDAPDELKFKGHYQRQEVFMGKCLKRQRELNRSWTLLVDSDEYVTFHNYEGATSEGMHRDCRPLEPDPRRQCVAAVNEAIQNGTHPRGHLPAIGEATFADYIHSESNNQDSMLNNFSCIVLPRIWMSANESPDRKIAKRVPKEFDPKAFVTLRYRHHSFFQNKFPGKSIVDVSKVKGDILVGNPHRVLGSACKYGPFVNTGNSLFRIHHYVGSPEVFLFRPGDTHRTMEEFQKRNSYPTVGTTDAMRGWLGSFIRRVGLDRALDVTTNLRQWAIETDAEISKALQKNATGT